MAAIDPNNIEAIERKMIIEVDNKIIGQTGAIARYCGKASNHYSNNDLHAAKIDETYRCTRRR